MTAKKKGRPQKREGLETTIPARVPTEEPSLSFMEKKRGSLLFAPPGTEGKRPELTWGEDLLHCGRLAKKRKKKKKGQTNQMQETASGLG